MKSAAPATPILCALIDPIKAGLARSLVRPGGTITGTLTQVEGLMGKQVELVRELMPQATTVGTEAVTRVRLKRRSSRPRRVLPFHVLSRLPVIDAVRPHVSRGGEGHLPVLDHRPSPGGNWPFLCGVLCWLGHGRGLQ